jgi:hypothetical protein
VRWLRPIISATQKVGVGGSQSRASPGKVGRLYLKSKLKQKVLEHLPSKHEALSSIPSTTTTTKQRERERERRRAGMGGGREEEINNPPSIHH